MFRQEQQAQVATVNLQDQYAAMTRQNGKIVDHQVEFSKGWSPAFMQKVAKWTLAIAMTLSTLAAPNVYAANLTTSASPTPAQYVQMVESSVAARADARKDLKTVAATAVGQPATLHHAVKTGKSLHLDSALKDANAEGAGGISNAAINDFLRHSSERLTKWQGNAQTTQLVSAQGQGSLLDARTQQNAQETVDQQMVDLNYARFSLGQAAMLMKTVNAAINKNMGELQCDTVKTCSAADLATFAALREKKEAIGELYPKVLSQYGEAHQIALSAKNLASAVRELGTKLSLADAAGANESDAEGMASRYNDVSIAMELVEQAQSQARDIGIVAPLSTQTLKNEAKLYEGLARAELLSAQTQTPAPRVSQRMS